MYYALQLQISRVVQLNFVSNTKRLHTSSSFLPFADIGGRLFSFDVRPVCVTGAGSLYSRKLLTFGAHRWMRPKYQEYFWQGQRLRTRVDVTHLLPFLLLIPGNAKERKERCLRLINIFHQSYMETY